VVGPIARETIAMFGADRCFYGSNFPIEKQRTDYGTLIPDVPERDCASRRRRTARGPARHRGAAPSDLTGAAARLFLAKALSIKYTRTRD
jgi:hypothetical protein